MRFDELDLDYDLLDALDAMQFSECTPIQEQAISVVLEGHDLIACAQTGTGKTAAYLLPVIDQIVTRHADYDAIKCVVMVPTHELAQQIDQQMEGFSYYLPVSSVAIKGGSDGKDFARQQRAIKMGADVVIATPGRLLAHIKMGYVDLSKVSFFVLDEADRMLDMGFYDDINQIVNRLPRERQTLMFSATMPDKIQRLANTILHEPVEIKIAVSRPTEKIDQSAYVCYEGQKTGILKHLFKTSYSQRVIVFAASKLKVKDLARALRKAGWNAGEMHSDLDQQGRESVMRDFRSGRIDIIVATDILARGIDIDDITMVVNYDVPREAEDYVHRIGRTARAGAGGKAVTFVSERDRQKFRYIERFLRYEVRKEDIPAALGKGPSYGTPKDDEAKEKPKSQGKRKKPAAPAKPVSANSDTADAQQPQPETSEQPPKPKRKKRYYRPRPKKSDKGGE